jgi:hypothetical protein
MHKKPLLRWYCEAICQGVAIGFCEILLIVWLTKTYTDPVALGLMLTVPAAIGALGQAFLTRGARHFVSAQVFAGLSVMVQVMGLAVLYLGVKFYSGGSTWIFLGQCFYWIGSMTSSSPTQEVLAKSVPVSAHNRFFSRRAIVITGVTLLSNYLATAMVSGPLTLQELSQFILIAGVARLLSASVLIQKIKVSSVQTSFSDALDTRSNSLVSIVRLGVFLFLFRMAVNISSPFFSGYILNSMGASLELYAFLTAVPLIVKTAFLHNWAKLLDDDRKFEGLFLAVFLIGIGPFLTGLFQNIPALVCFQILSGISWSGFDLISVLLVQHMYPRSITDKLGLFLALGSLGSVVGGMVGGWLFKVVANYGILFTCSSIARLITGFLLLWYLRRNHLFRFHELNLKGGLATLVTIRPSLDAALKLIPLSPKRIKVNDKG